MNNNTTSQYMDKQIMDLSNSQSPISTTHNNNSGSDFIDFMNRPAEKKDDIVPSYDFMPIRSTLGSSSPTAARSSNLDSAVEDAPHRTWNSVDSHINASPVRNYSSPDADEPAKFILGRNHKSSDVPLDASLVSEIDRTMKKHMDNLIHAVDKMSARLSQLESRTRNIESSIDDIKAIVENNHGTSDGKMRLLENVLTEVHTGVQFIRDKQEIIEAQLQIAKLHQVPKVEQAETQNNANPGPTQTSISAHQQFPQNVQPNAPPPPLPQQNVQPHVQQHPNPFPQNQIPPIPHQESSYFPPPSQNPENPSQQYQIPQPPPPQQQHHPATPPALQQHQYPPPPQPQYSQPPPPSKPQFSSIQPPPPSQPQFSPIPPPAGQHLEETPYIQSQTYAQAQGIHPPSGAPPPSQQYYGANPNIYEPPSSRIGPGSGYSGSFGEPYPYSSSPVKSQQISSSGMGQSGYPQLPTARILPQALPTASAVGGGSGSGSGSGSGNRVPIDDVVDRVTNMGFPREQVRATVRKLTENGQAVDLNVVLDKLMNDGNGQGPRGGWHLGR